MKKIVRILLVVLVVVTLLCLIGNAAESPNYHWKINYMYPIGHPIDNDANWIANELNKRSNGRIKLDLYPSSQLGDVTIVQERIGLGDVEMQLAWFDTTIDARLAINNLPYIVTNFEEVRKLYKKGGFMMNTLENLLKEQNIKMISRRPMYFCGIALTKLPSSPKDTDVPKNMKLRVPPSPSYSWVVENLGYLATPIVWSEIFTSLQTGIIDGYIGGDEDACYTSFRDIIKYYLAIADHYEMWFWYMNLDLWNSLSKEDQKILQDVGDELYEKSIDTVEEEQVSYQQRLRDSGIEVITFTDEELTKIAKKMRENVWPKLREVIGPELMDEVLDQVK